MADLPMKIKLEFDAEPLCLIVEELRELRSRVERLERERGSWPPKLETKSSAQD